MKVLDVIKKLIEFGEVNNEVFVRIITRDYDGNVVTSKAYPVSQVFSTRSEIIIEL